MKEPKASAASVCIVGAVSERFLKFSLRSWPCIKRVRYDSG